MKRLAKVDSPSDIQVDKHYVVYYRTSEIDDVDEMHVGSGLEVVDLIKQMLQIDDIEAMADYMNGMEEFVIFEWDF